MWPLLTLTLPRARAVTRFLSQVQARRSTWWQPWEKHVSAWSAPWCTTRIVSQPIHVGNVPQQCDDSARSKRSFGGRLRDVRLCLGELDFARRSVPRTSLWFASSNPTSRHPQEIIHGAAEGLKYPRRRGRGDRPLTGKVSDQTGDDLAKEGTKIGCSSPWTERTS